jgi:hypothetical protein
MTAAYSGVASSWCGEAVDHCGVQLSAEGMAKDIDLPYLMHPSNFGNNA